MRKLVLMAMSTIALSGCITANNVAHKYSATPYPELAGHWVGSATGQTHTMLLRQDGTGEVCWEAGRGYQTMPVKISGNKIITMMESDLKVNSNGTFSQCAWGVCINFQRTINIPAACREWLKS